MALEILPMDLEGVFPTRTLPKILCCLCGVEIESNPANMCVNCLRTQVDITDGIPKQVVMYQCRGCDRFLRPPWVAVDLESRELLAVCLKKINGLSKVKLVDAGFIWTEPHSKRLKVKLTIQKEVLNGVRLQQVFAVEFVIHNQQCDACQRSYTDHTWRALVQVRQRVTHKKTFFLLEQLILKHNAHEKCINVEQVPNGVDFAFADKAAANKFIDFLSSVVPARSKVARQLISEDTQNGDQNYKFSYAVELVPLCKDDLVVLPAATAAALGHINPVCLVLRVLSQIYVVDPRTLQMAELSGDRYWAAPFRALASGERLEEYTVLDITPVTVAPITGAALRRKQHHKGRRGRRGNGDSTAASEASDRAAETASVRSISSGAAGGVAKAGAKRKASATEDRDDVASVRASTVASSKFAGGFTGGVSLAGGSVMFNGAMSVASTVSGGPKGKFLLADAEVMRTRDMGVSDTRYTVRTHLGNLLRPGDTVLGYDLSSAVYNEADAEAASTGGRSRTKGTAGRAFGGAGGLELPDIVLVRKCYPRRGAGSSAAPWRDGDAATASVQGSTRRGAGSTRSVGSASEAASAVAAVAAATSVPPAAKQRVWKLRRFQDVVPTREPEFQRKGDADRAQAEYESFLRELEEDPSLRASVNLYKNREAIEARQRALAASAAQAKLQARVTVSDGQQDTANGTAVRFAETASSSAPTNKEARTGDDEESESEADQVQDQGAAAGTEVGLEELLDDLDLDGGAGPSSASRRGGGLGSGAYTDPQDEEALSQLKQAAVGNGKRVVSSAERDAVAAALQAVEFESGTAAAIPEADDEDEASDEDESES